MVTKQRQQPGGRPATASSAPPSAGPSRGACGAAAASTKARGDAAEDRALAWLQAHGLDLVQRNYRVARGPSAHGGEIDLVMREHDGTLVFVEVRARADASRGGAAASVGLGKQRKLLWAARHYLLGCAAPPPCRIDVVAVDGDGIEWLRGAFDDSGA